MSAKKWMKRPSKNRYNNLRKRHRFFQIGAKGTEKKKTSEKVHKKNES